MHLMQHDKHSRRAFLRRSGHLALMGAAAPLGLNLAAMGEAAAFNANDYKALVCVFLFGGNDHANTVVAYDNASHADYARIRAAGAGTAAGSIALQRAGWISPPFLIVPLVAHAFTWVSVSLSPTSRALQAVFMLNTLLNTSMKYKGIFCNHQKV